MGNTMAWPENEAGKEAERSRRGWHSSIHHLDCYVTASDRVQSGRVYSCPCKTLFELEFGVVLVLRSVNQALSKQCKTNFKFVIL